MGSKTKIEWASHSWSPWRGCTRVVEECKFCYADAISKRNPNTLGVWGPNGKRVVAANWEQVERWNTAAGQRGERLRIFPSMCDPFEEWSTIMHDHHGEPIEKGGVYRTTSPGGQTSTCQDMLTMTDVRRRFFALIDRTPHLDWLLLTKRPQNIRAMWPKERVVDIAASYGGGSAACADLPKRLENVWLVTSAGTQESANRFIPELLKCRDLAPVLGVSCEPMLEPVTFRWASWAPVINTWHLDGLRLLDWVIIGCESNGPRVGRLGAFKSESDWIDGAVSIVEQCREAGVAVYVKQIPQGGMVCHDVERFPEPLRYREFPPALTVNRAI